MEDNASRALQTLRNLRQQYASTPFLALGQTVWWDEPMKAVLTVLLRRAGVNGAFVLGVHDTDYFAKLHTRLPGEERFSLLPHNDGTTRDLWSAAGEIAQLFGSECFPTRHDLTRSGTPLRALAAHAGVDLQEFLNQHTAAWGWRGLVYTGSRDTVVCELKLADILPGIRSMLEYGFNNTVAAIETRDVARQAQLYANDLMESACECCTKQPEATLTTLYRHMYPRMFRLLLGDECPEYQVTSTSELLRFGPDTAGLPRFRLLDVFLHPGTRPIAEQAYNDAVAGSEMYTLPKFGLGALPFDLVVPGIGRGTLRVTLRAVHIEMPEPRRIRTVRPVQDAKTLAVVLREHFGRDVILVGKAVTLISMLASEFIFVFNEEGSAYVTRTRRMNDFLQSYGVRVAVHPVLRLLYRTWDSAAGVATEVRLPEPMRGPFAASSMSMDRFGRVWRQVVEDQQRLLDSLAAVRSPRRLLEMFCERSPGLWRCPARRHSDLTQRLVALAEEWGKLQAVARRLHAELRETRLEIARIEKERGQHFRSVAEWTPEHVARREALGAELARLHERRRVVQQQLRTNQLQRVAWGRQPDIQQLRAERRKIQLEAERARLELVRDALLTVRGLPHADHRPSAWWLPFVDPSGGWFRRVVETAEVYVQPLVSGEVSDGSHVEAP